MSQIFSKSEKRAGGAWRRRRPLAAEAEGQAPPARFSDLEKIWDIYTS